jgi:hypothetical protein
VLRVVTTRFDALVAQNTAGIIPHIELVVLLHRLGYCLRCGTVWCLMVAHASGLARAACCRWPKALGTSPVAAQIVGYVRRQREINGRG